MKVLRHGNTYKEIECDKCGALLSYCEVDVEIKKYDQYKYIPSYNENVCLAHFQELFIECPECSNEIVLKYYVDGVEMEYSYVN